MRKYISEDDYFTLGFIDLYKSAKLITYLNVQYILTNVYCSHSKIMYRK